MPTTHKDSLYYYGATKDDYVAVVVSQKGQESKLIVLDVDKDEYVEANVNRHSMMELEGILLLEVGQFYEEGIVNKDGHRWDLHYYVSEDMGNSWHEFNYKREGTS